VTTSAPGNVLGALLNYLLRREYSVTTTGITTKIMKITPMQASSWLASSNVDNRLVRKLLSFANPDKKDLKRIPEANHNEMEELKLWAKKVIAGEDSIWERSSKPLCRAGAGAI
jgi:hypothetical protein